MSDPIKEIYEQWHEFARTRNTGALLAFSMKLAQVRRHALSLKNDR